MSDTETEIMSLLDSLDPLCPAGYALAFHIRYATPNFLFQTYATDWIDIYSQRGYVMTDPTVRWGFENLGWCRWSDLADDDAAGVLAEAAQHGLGHGFVFALETEGSRSMTSFARNDRSFSDDEVNAIRVKAARLHDLTAGLAELSPDTAAKLRRMAIRVSHPGSQP